MVVGSSPAICSHVDVFLSFLHTRLRTATLRHDADGQAVLVNLLLRNYLHFNLYDQAEKLVSKSVFPELANNNEWARYLYYTGESIPVPKSSSTHVVTGVCWFFLPAVSCDLQVVLRRSSWSTLKPAGL